VLGRLTVIGLAVIAVVLGSGCAEEFQGREPLDKGLHYPLGMAVDEIHGLLYVVNSNFDLAYSLASVVSVSLDGVKSGNWEFKSANAAMESFPGEFILVRGSGGDQRGYLSVRGDNSVTWFNVLSPGAGGGVPVLDCGGLDEGGSAVCVGEHVIAKAPAPEWAEDEDEIVVGSDPYGLAYVQGRDGEGDYLVSAGMRDGAMALMQIGADGKPVPVDRITVTPGLHSLAVDPVTRDIYATTKSYPVVYRYRIAYPAGKPKLELVSAITMPAPFSTADFGRGIAVTPDGRYALVASRTPNALLVMDAQVSPLGDSERAVRAIPLDGKPGQVRVFASGKDGASVAYVLSFSDDRVWAFDVASLQPRAVIRTSDGPYDMAAIINDKMKLGFVSNFLQHTISVIDLDFASETYHTIIGEIQP